MTPRPPCSTLTDSLFPITTLFRACSAYSACSSVNSTRNRRPANTTSAILLRFDVPFDHRQRRTPNRGDEIGVSPQRRQPGFQPRELLAQRSEEQTSELTSLMRNSNAVFCFKKKINRQ